MVEALIKAIQGSDLSIKKPTVKTVGSENRFL